MNDERNFFVELLASKENPHVKRLVRLLSSRREREMEDAFVCEGARLILDGVSSGTKLLEFYATERAMERYPALRGTAAVAGRASLITEPVAEKIADTKSTQGVFAVFKRLDNSETAGTIKGGGDKRSYVLLSSVRDPGNLGAVMRSCEAFGVTELILSGDCADVYSPKTLRAGMGSIFRLPVRICDELAEEIGALREAGVTVYAAALRPDAKPLGGFSFPRDAAVLIGNEGCGLPEEQIDACDGTVIIPMAGGAESLNAGVAAGILAWEMTRVVSGKN